MGPAAFKSLPFYIEGRIATSACRKVIRIEPLLCKRRHDRVFYADVTGSPKNSGLSPLPSKIKKQYASTSPVDACYTRSLYQPSGRQPPWHINQERGHDEGLVGDPYSRGTPGSISGKDVEIGRQTTGER